jgi:tetratricopeptide (TPR) repeat protein
MLLAFLLSTIIQSPNPTEAWLSPGFQLFSLAVIYFLSANFCQEKSLNRLGWALILSGSLLSIMAIYQLLGITANLADEVDWLGNKLWNPTGSPVSLILIALSGASLALTKALKKPGSILAAGVMLFLALVQTIAAALVVSELLPGKENTIAHLPYGHGYSIAIDSLKNWRTALFGVGPDNFLSAFTRFKPLSYNLIANLWDVRFTTSSNEVFQAMTTTGLMGLLAWIWLGFYLIKNLFVNRHHHLEWSLVTGVTVIYLLLFTANTVILTWVFAVLIVNNLVQKPKKEIKFGFSGAGLIIGLLLLTVATGCYYSYKYGLAELKFRRATLSLSKNQGLPTYNHQRETLLANPHRVNYRIAYARTNLALATGLAGQNNLSPKDNQTIVQLIQQGVREARAAVQLNPQNVTAWENLAETYRQLINFANNADKLAIQSYSQALTLDPRNPRLWVDYGGLLLSTNRSDAAIQAFRQAVALKPDYANAYYNLASALMADNKFDQANQEVQKLITLIDQNSQDYQAVNQLTKEIEEKLSTAGNQKDAHEITRINELPTLSVSSPAPEKPEELEVIDLPETDLQF